MAGFAISAASAVSGFMAQEQQAKTQDGIYRQNQANALAAFQDQNAAITRRQAQEQDAAAEQKFDTALDARKARATQEVVGGEYGSLGLSFESLLQDFGNREDRAVGRIDQNTEWTMAQLQDAKKGGASQYVDRVNSVQRGVKPSFVDLGLKVAGAGINSATSYRRNKL